MVASITLASGDIALVSEEDEATVRQFRWYLSNGYAFSQRAGMLHNFLMGTVPDGFQVDHINRDKLDNTRENLRVVTVSENLLNRPVYKNSQSGFRYVNWREDRARWVGKPPGNPRRHFRTVGEAVDYVHSRGWSTS